VLHAAPQVRASLPAERVVHSSQNLLAQEGQQKREEDLADLVSAPASFGEEARKSIRRAVARGQLLRLGFFQRKGTKTQRGGRVTENEISRVVVDAAIEVHRTLGGPGLLESVYEEALAELELRGVKVERQRTVPLVYKGKRLASDLRVDLLLENRVFVECKATIANTPVFQAQALTDLRLMDLELALVVNFGMRLVKDGINRVANGL
jgi:GxxExxY protein